jgi:hypothetical protein
MSEVWEGDVEVQEEEEAPEHILVAASHSSNLTDSFAFPENQ